MGSTRRRGNIPQSRFPMCPSFPLIITVCLHSLEFLGLHTAACLPVNIKYHISDRWRSIVSLLVSTLTLRGGITGQVLVLSH